MIVGIDASRANRSHKTGTEWYSYYLIRHLARIDEQNQYILYTDQPLTGGLMDLTTDDLEIKEMGLISDPIEFKNGHQTIRSPHGNFKAKVLNWPFLYFWTQGRLSLEMLFPRIDVLFIPAHTLPFVHPSKSVVTIHDIAFERDRLLYQRRDMGPDSRSSRRLINVLVRLITLNRYGANSLDYLSWSTRLALKHAKKIISVSQFTKDDIIEAYGVGGQKIAVIPNGYNRELYREITDHRAIADVLKKYDIGRPYFLYVGRLEKKKNTPNLIEAYADLRQKSKELKHKLVLVGDASYGYDEVNYAIREYNLDNEVIMPGWVEEADMPYLYNGADAFVFPSRYEGFGIPLLQAMACGVPIAASCASSIPEVAGDAALLFDPYNIRAISEAMHKVVTDNDLRRTLINRGRERVKNFDFDRCARMTLKVIKEL